ncbi:Proton-coupled folate transporter [Hyphodiscus hymeniophilus]|uniref:Proton-coupled folate transporter n=1 Tax=Hyphodiscus hymeniophilus TaxID=353542 RepID=A0A9P6VFJ9_9HELO|nr:Proton-coupled folate transporter [Hyphodiscus hymeniophilus]
MDTMDNEREYGGRESLRDGIEQAGADNGHWDAVGSLKRNAKRPDTEVTPLLGNSSGLSEERVDGPAVPEWEGNADHEGLTWWYKPSLYWLLPSFFLFALAFGGIIVPKLNLILELVCRDYLIERHASDPSYMFTPVLLGADNPQCRQIPEIQSLATKFILYLTIIVGALTAVMAPKLGSISDRHGRIKVLVVSSFGAFCGEIITILAAKYPDTVKYQWLLLGAVLDGLCGSFTTGMAITHAYAADCTPPPKRAVAFGYFHACLFAGIALGPLIAAFLVKATGQLITIFYVALGVHVFFMLFVLLIIPESLTKKRQQLARERFAAEGESIAWDGYSWLWAMRKGNILAPLQILWPTGPGSSGHLRANLILLSAVDTIIFGVAMGSMTVVVYYTGYQFDWGTEKSSDFISIVSTARVSALMIFLPLFVKIVRGSRAKQQRRDSGFVIPERNSGSDSLDLSIVRFSIMLEVLGYAGYALVRTGPLFILCGILAACGGVGSPTLQSALTKHVPHDRVGQLLGATGVLHALARIVCPAVFNLIYAGTVKKFPQAVFVVLASCFGVAFCVSWFIRPNGELLHFVEGKITDSVLVYLEDTDETTANPTRGDTEPTSDTIVDEEIGGY